LIRYLISTAIRVSSKLSIRLAALSCLVLTSSIACRSTFAVDITFNISYIAESNPFPPSGSLFSYADVWSENGYAYVGSNRPGRGTAIFSISNSGIPPYLEEYDGIAGDGSEYEDVEVYDGIGYFAADVSPTTSGTGVDIVDLSIPFDPVHLGRVNSSDCLAGNPSVCAHNKVHTLSIQRINPNTPSEQRFLYTSDNATSVVKITDVTNPSSPQLVRSLSLSSVGSAVDSHEVIVRNNRLYVASKDPNQDGSEMGDGDGWFHIYDVTTPANPLLLKAFESGISTHTAAPTADGRTLVVAEERLNGNVKIYDISMIDQPNDPQNPVLLATLNESNVCHGGDCIDAHSPHHVHIYGNLLFLPWYEAGLQVFNIVDPANPVYVGAYDTSAGNADNFSGNWGVDLSRGLDQVMLSDRQRGLIVLNATGVLAPGDYNMDTQVNDADYSKWTQAFGTTSSGAHDGPIADGNYDEIIDAADYVVWRKFYGTSGPGSPLPGDFGGSPAVPEPGTMLLLAVGAGLMFSLCRSRVAAA
jgi:hypothetical protein